MKIFCLRILRHKLKGGYSVADTCPIYRVHYQTLEDLILEQFPQIDFTTKKFDIKIKKLNDSGLTELMEILVWGPLVREGVVRRNPFDSK